MAARRKKMDADCFRPFDWLSSIEPRKLPFYPQIGDDVMYFRQGHELYLNTVKQQKLYKINSTLHPWSRKVIHQQELVRIIDITYEIKPPRLVCLTLGRLDPRNGALTRKHFVIKYHDIDEIPDFLVLKQDYDTSMKRQWNSSQRFRCLMNDDCGVQMWWEGQFIKHEPFNPQFPESKFLCYVIRWDNGNIDCLSPWDLENIDPQRKSLSVGAGVRVLPIEIERASYMPTIDDWPPLGDRDSESDRISAQISQVMAMDVAKHFSAPVDLDKFPNYASVVKYPMDLRTIQMRLDHRFYRRVAALEYDIHRIHTNALLFNDPKKSSIVRDSCITIALCFAIIRNGDVDVTALNRQLLERCETKELGGNIHSSGTSYPIQGSSQPLFQVSSRKILSKQQCKTEHPTEETSIVFARNSVVAGSIQSSTPAQKQNQKFILKANQVGKEQRTMEASSVSSKGHISLNFSSFANVDGTKTEIDLAMDGQKRDDNSKLENINNTEVRLTSRTKEKTIDREEVKVEYAPKLKPTASVSPYTLRRKNESAAINLEVNVSADVNQNELSIVRSASRRSRLPVHKVGKENLDTILSPESKRISFPTVSPSISTGVGVFDWPENSSETCSREEICCRKSEVTITSSIRKSINSDDSKLGPKWRKTSTSGSNAAVLSDQSTAGNHENKFMFARYVQHELAPTESASKRNIYKLKNDNLANPSQTLTRSPLLGILSTNHTGIEVLTTPKDRSYSPLCTSNNRFGLTDIRKNGHSLNTLNSTASTPVPLAVSTPKRMRKEKNDSKTNVGLVKSRLLTNDTDNEINQQSPYCSPSSENPCVGKKRNKRRFSRSVGWNISLVKSVAQESSGPESLTLQKPPSQQYSSTRIVEETYNTFCDTPAKIYPPVNDQVASLTSIVQERTVFSVMTEAPTPAESTISNSHGASHQPESCNKSNVKESQNQTHYPSKDQLLTKGQDHPQNQEISPTPSKIFSPPSRDSLLKKTLKKEHQTKWSTCKTSVSQKENPSELTDNRSEITGRSSVPLSKDAAVAKIRIESKLHVPRETTNGFKSKTKPRKGKGSGIPASSKVKKTDEEPLNVGASIEEIMKKYLGNESSDELPDGSKKGKKKNLKAHKKKRADELISKGATAHQHKDENVADVLTNMVRRGKKDNTARKRTHAKNPTINEQLDLVERLLRERKSVVSTSHTRISITN